MNKPLPFLALLLAGCGSAASGGGGTSFADAPASLPDALKNDAFEYYGLGNTKTLKYQIVQGEGGLPQDANRTVVPGKTEGDKAIYVLKQTGGLASEGDITLSLEKDGIYAMSSSANKIKPHSLEMPAKLDVGGGWKDHTEMSDQKIVLDNDLKIVGRERVSTPGGTFDDALHVTSTGQGIYQGDPVELTTESWYVRGLGPVKQIVEVTSKAKPKRSFTMQLASPDATATADAGPSMPPDAGAPDAAPMGTPPAGPPPGAKK